MRRWSNPPGWSRLISYAVIPIAVALGTIGNAAITYPLLPIEFSDETAHTFLEIPRFLSTVFSGTLLKIDLGQNFGAPLLGDPVVNPLAPHAITYALFPPLTAMLINKAALAASSVMALTAFFAGYYVLPIASVCALLTFTSPSFFYHFQNHPHQGALLYFALVLLAIRVFLKQPSRSRMMTLFVALTAFCLGVGINGAIIGFAFIVGFVLLSPIGESRTRTLALLVCGLSVVALYPHFAEFLRLARRSARIHLNYYQTVFTTSPQDLLLGLFVPSREDAFSGLLVHYSPAVILLIGFGLFLLSRLRSRRAFGRLATRLGLVPLVGVVVGLCLLPTIARTVSIVGSTNITRVLWFSDVFLMLALGFALENLAALDLNRKQFVLGCLVLLVGVSPRFVVAAWQATGFRAQERNITFQPTSFLRLMQPGTRLAADIDPVPDNFDIKAIPHGILASSGRSIVLNNELRSALLSEGLIETTTEGTVYYFTASPPERLARFGIRYFATRDSAERLQAQGWQWRAADAGFVLYESPLAVTPIYIDGRQPEFVTSYTIVGNGVAIDLPPGRRDYTVVATFLATPGWKAAIDARAVPIHSGPDGMLAVSVDEGHRLRLEYEPYSDSYLFAVFGISLLFVAGGAQYLFSGGAPGRAAHPAQVS